MNVFCCRNFLASVRRWHYVRQGKSQKLPPHWRKELLRFALNLLILFIIIWTLVPSSKKPEISSECPKGFQMSLASCASATSTHLYMHSCFCSNTASCIDKNWSIYDVEHSSCFKRPHVLYLFGRPALLVTIKQLKIVCVWPSCCVSQVTLRMQKYFVDLTHWAECLVV